MGALSPYRVLDLTDHTGWLCGRMLADLGADVVKIEPPGGDPGRWWGRHAGDSGRPEDSLTWWSQNHSKRSVVLDVDGGSGREQLLELVAGADVLVESAPPGAMAARGLGVEVLLGRQPALVVTSITPFGQTGPHAHHRATDITIAARCGLSHLTGDPDRPPLRISSPQMWRHASAEAAVHTLVALWHAQSTGHGQHVDVSAQLAGVRTLMNATAFPLLEGIDLRRRGAYSAYSHARLRMIFPAADGFVTLLLSSGPVGGPGLNLLMEWSDREHLLPDDLRGLDFTEIDFGALAHTEDGTRIFSLISETVGRFTALHTKAELYALALEHRLLLGPLYTAADLRADPQLAARGFFTTVDWGALGHRTVAGPWARLSATPMRPAGRPPGIGEHTAEVLDGAPRRPAPSGGGSGPEPTRVFEGLKVWDMSWVGVGPLTTRYLADHGATVIRLDSTVHPDVLRLAPPFKDGKPGINNSHFYADFNASKLGLALDMRTEPARAVARRLATWADVVVESFTPGTLADWGLDYASLRELNPGLVMLSTCMQGQTGPRATYRGFGNLMAAMAGFYTLTGWPDRAPVMIYGAYTDFICQRLCATALLAALDHRRRTGEGQYIDVAQSEAALQFLGPELLDHEVNGRVAERAGNDDIDMAPHGVYPCHADDDAAESWVAIAVPDDDSWRALTAILGSPDWAADPVLATTQGRLAARRRLDDHLAAWTAAHSADDVVTLLQPDVAAGEVLDQSGLQADPQIVHRGYFVTLEHTHMGPVPYNGMQAALSRTPGRLSKAGPCVGEDSFAVLTEVLGMDEGEVAALIGDGVVEVVV